MLLISLAQTGQVMNGKRKRTLLLFVLEAPDWYAYGC